jgi:hypothetical protein
MKVLTFLEFGKKGGGEEGFIVFWFGLVLNCGEVGVEVGFLFFLFFLKGWGSLLGTFNPPKAQKDEVLPTLQSIKEKLVHTPPTFLQKKTKRKTCAHPHPPHCAPIKG